MTKKLVSFDDQAEPGEGLPAAVKAELSATYAPGINVRAHGAVGNGTADDTDAVIAAVAQALAESKPLHWPPGGYLTTTNIPGLHAVTHRGGGYIIRDGTNFYPAPTKSWHRNILHVSPDGEPANDGLSPAAAKSVQSALDALPNYGPVLDGRWAIQHAAGTYQGGYGFPRMEMRNKVEFRGPNMGGPRVTPTAVYERGSAAITWAVYTPGRTQVEFRDLKFVGFNHRAYSQGGSGGILVGEYNSVTLYNIHTDNCVIGAYILSHSYYVLGGCHFKNSSYAGIHELYMVLRTVGSVKDRADGTLFEGNFFGIKAKEACNGHGDYSTFLDNTYAVHLSRNSSMNVTRSLFERNQHCMVASAGSQFVDLFCIFGTGTAANGVKIRYLGDSTNVALSGTEDALSAPYIGAAEKSFGYGRTSSAHTGTTVDTLLVPMGTFRQGDFKGEGAWIRWDVYGDVSLSATAELRVRLAGTTVAVPILPAGAYQFKWEGRMYVTADGETQRVDSIVHRSNGNPLFAGGSRTLPVGSNASNPMGLYVKLGATSDYVNISQAFMFTSDI